MCNPTNLVNKPPSPSSVANMASFVPPFPTPPSNPASASKRGSSSSPPIRLSAASSASPASSSSYQLLHHHHHYYLSTAFATLGNILSSLWKRKYKVILWSFLGLTLVTCLSFTALYLFSPGFRRTVQFWRGMAPIALKYKFLKFKSFKIDTLMEEDDLYKERLSEFNLKTAPKIVDLMLELGGIYVKIGQVMSTIGQGLLPPAYIEALQPLQNGVPPRPFPEIRKIVEESTGMPLEDNFAYFEEEPIGSASIAQAHVAVLRRKNGKNGSNGIKNVNGMNKKMNNNSNNNNNNESAYEEKVQAGEKVIVKIQYPEVAQNFQADLRNMEIVTRMIAPQNMELVKALRERHERELDFRIEAQNLREVRNNMRGYGLEPRVVRIPRVIDHIVADSVGRSSKKSSSSLCTQHVLVMEYLDGVPLSKVIDQEQIKMASAMRMKNGKGDSIVDVKEFKEELAKRMRQHFERGGGGGDDVDSMNTLFGGSKSAPKLVQVSLPFLARVFRGYVALRENVAMFTEGVRNVLKSNVEVVDAAINGDLMERRPDSSLSSERRVNYRKFNLSRILKTLIHVHGIQMMKDGVYNADPHPGNVVILNDGRVGLLDYGMVGRLKDDDRISISKTVLALSENDKATTAEIYRGAGYRATWKNGNNTNAHEDDHILHRFASFHLDKIDLSPLTLQSGEEVPMREFFGNVREVSVPIWVEEARRLGGLMMGVSAQAARPISLSREWKEIAKDVVEEHEKKISASKGAGGLSKV